MIEHLLRTIQLGLTSDLMLLQQCSDPVVLHDDDFRFDVDLNTGATTGEIFLVDRIAGPRIRCLINMIGTGQTAAGDNTSVYWGRCSIRSARR